MVYNIATRASITLNNCLCYSAIVIYSYSAVESSNLSAKGNFGNGYTKAYVITASENETITVNLVSPVNNN
jgi:hypothetical protein